MGMDESSFSVNCPRQISREIGHGLNTLPVNPYSGHSAVFRHHSVSPAGGPVCLCFSYDFLSDSCH